MPKESMTARERWEAVLDRRKPDRVPMDYWATPEADEKLMRHLRVNTIEEAHAKLHIDRPLTVSPRYVGPPRPPGTNQWGCRVRRVRYETGVYEEIVSHPLASCSSIEEIDANYRWPSTDWYDYSHLAEEIRGQEHRPVQAGGSEPFLVYCELRGLELGMMDLVTVPEIVRHCLGKLFDFAYENTRRIYEAIPGRVLISYVAEDMGSQTDLLFSPEAIRTFFLPGMKRMNELAHSAGARVFYHSDGAVRKIVPDMIAIGIDVLNPVQWRCEGMERQALKRDFGDKVIFHGGVDNQHTIPFGTQDEVRREVRENIRILGAGGGYILAPCHNIQAVGPAENVVAMYEEGYACGWT
ncbi:MAG: uroporphyrinogen decarboxylase family protein [Planctomycetota bacterium]